MMPSPRREDHYESVNKKLNPNAKRCKLVEICSKSYCWYVFKKTKIEAILFKLILILADKSYNLHSMKQGQYSQYYDLLIGNGL